MVIKILRLACSRMWMDHKGILCEISQTEKDRYWMISLICGILPEEKKDIEKEIRFAVTRSSGWEEGELEKGSQKTSSYKINKY